jgi:hypothetical protein
MFEATTVRVACLQLHDGLVVIQTCLLQVLGHIFLQSKAHVRKDYQEIITFHPYKQVLPGTVRAQNIRELFIGSFAWQFGANHTGFVLVLSIQLLCFPSDRYNSMKQSSHESYGRKLQKRTTP